MKARAKTIAGLLCGLISLVALMSLLAGDSAADAPAGRYILSAGTVRDTRTGLVWQLSDAAGGVNWSQAKRGCDTLTLADSIWRLPSIKELATLIDPAGPPYVDATAFGPSTGAISLWSSSEVVGSPEYYWVQGVTSPTISPNHINSGQYVHIRCVRVGPRPPVVDAGPPPPTVSFRDDFEDGTFDNWTVGSSQATYAVTADSAAAGTSRSLQIKGATDWYNGLSQTFNDFRPSHASWWIQIGKWGGSGTGAVALSADANATRQLMQFFVLDTAFTFDGSKQISSFRTITPVLGRWYHVEVDFDWTAESFTARVDGVTIGETGFVPGTTSPTAVRLDVFNANGATAAWDEIEIGP